MYIVGPRDGYTQDRCSPLFMFFMCIGNSISIYMTFKSLRAHIKHTIPFEGCFFGLVATDRST